MEKLGGIVKPSEPNYFRDPNATVVIDERGWPTLRKQGSLDSKNGEPWDYPEEMPEESAPEKMLNSIGKKVPDWNIRQQRKQSEMQTNFYKDYVNKNISYEEWLEKLRRKYRR